MSKWKLQTFGIAHKLGLLLSVFGVLAAGLTGYYSYSESRTLLVNAAETELLTSTQVIGRRFTMLLNESTSNVRLLAALPATRLALQSAVDADRLDAEERLAVMFTEMLGLHPEYFQVRLIAADNHGRERVRVDRNENRLERVSGSQLQEKAQYPYVYQTLRLQPGAVYLSRILINHEAGAHQGVDKPMLQVATPIVSEQGDKLGLVVINMNLNGLFASLKDDLPRDVQLYLTNKEGDFLIHPDPALEFGFDRGRRVRLQELYPAAAPLFRGHADSVVFNLPATGQHEQVWNKAMLLPDDQTAAFLQLSFGSLAPERFLVLGLSRPLQSLFKGTQLLGQTIIQIIAVFSVGAILLSVVVTRILSRPLNMMVSAVRRFAVAHEMGELPIRGNDEIGLLARAFADMEALLRGHLSSLHEKEQHLQHLAQHDHLTNLPNRFLLFDRLRQSIAKSHRAPHQIAVIFIDLDRFKDINDSLGHAVGDEVIQQIAQRLRALFRDEDTVARLGGDEFVVVLDPVEELSYVAVIAQKMLPLLHGPMKIQGRDLYISASLGISIYPQDGMDAQTLVRNADAAMYRAKAEGRNTFHFYTEDMTEKAMARVQLETELRRALDNEEFRLYYQPQLDLRSGKIIGFEALIRWQHPQRHLLAPGEFIPLAEETGLIEPIGQWVLKTACAQMKRWHEAGLQPGRVAVNLSAKQLQRKDLANTVLSILDATGCRPEWLELEVTESVFLQDPEESIAILESVRSMGIELSIDDFGTGYSSLSYLKHLPVSTLKIDRSFIKNIPAAPDDMAIIRAIIALAGSLKLQVIAEGVETEEQRLFLKVEGCQQAQGFLFSRPVPVEKAEQILRQGFAVAAK